MTGLLTNSEQERLKSYTPLGWREQIGPSLRPTSAMGYALPTRTAVRKTTVQDSLRESRIDVDCHERICR